MPQANDSASGYRCAPWVSPVSNEQGFAVLAVEYLSSKATPHQLMNMPVANANTPSCSLYNPLKQETVQTCSKYWYLRSRRATRVRPSFSPLGSSPAENSAGTGLFPLADTRHARVCAFSGDCWSRRRDVQLHAHF